MDIDTKLDELERQRADEADGEKRARLDQRITSLRVLAGLRRPKTKAPKRRPHIAIQDTDTFHSWDRESKEFLGPALPSAKTVLATFRTKQKLGLLKNLPLAHTAPWRSERLQARGHVDQYLASGGTITQCPPKQHKYVFGRELAKHVDRLRKQAKRGAKPSDVQAGRIFLGLITHEEVKEQAKADAMKELKWLRQRALPEPYVPKPELACDPHSIRPKTPWDFEDRFLDRLGAGETWGDVFYDDYHHDFIERDPNDKDDKDYSPSASVHELVQPDYTQSLNKLFGYEEEQRLLKNTIRDTAEWAKPAWSEYKTAWAAVLAEMRKQNAQVRADWQKRIHCPG